MEADLEKVQTAHIVDWNHEGCGVGRTAEGKVVFIQGALPAETVYWRQTRQRKSYTEGEVVGWLHASASRTIPACDYYSRCGGCNSQHIEASAQVALKQRAWFNQMRRIGKVCPQQVLPPVYGYSWQYRERVRFSIARRQGQLQLGFQHKQRHDVVDINHCLILPEAVSAALPAIKNSLNLPVFSDVSAVGVHVGDAVIALSIQAPVLSQAMRQKLNLLIDQLSQTGVLPWQWWWLHQQEAQWQYPPSTPVLAYSLPEYQLRIPFTPQDFTQVNQHTNALMVRRAMQWLQPAAGEYVIDWFCGLGNFSLALARLGARVLGVEGVAAMSVRAGENARLNALQHHCDFQHADLFKINTRQLRQFGLADKWLLDPPRAGAQTLIKALSGLGDHELPRRIVYVSCDPATLARDAGLLVARGYAYRAGGIMNLFAQTAHVESMAVFEWPHELTNAAVK